MRNRIGRPRFMQSFASGGSGLLGMPQPPTTPGPWGIDQGVWVEVVPEAPRDGLIYGRQNDAWVPAAGSGGGIDIATGDGRYVNQNGDTMTGPLTISLAWANIVLVRPDTTSGIQIQSKVAADIHWNMVLGTSDAASNFSIDRYSDAGAFLSQGLTINRLTGATTIWSVVPSTSPTTGALTVAGGIGVGGSITMEGGVEDYQLRALSGEFAIWAMAAGVARVHINGSGDVRVTSPSPSTSTTTGALRVDGGVGVGGNIVVNGLIDINNDLYVGKVQTGVNSAIHLRSASNQQGWFNFWQGAQQRISILCQSGSGDLLFARWNDLGAFIDTPVQISRSTGDLITLTSLILGPASPEYYQLMNTSGEFLLRAVVAGVTRVHINGSGHVLVSSPDPATSSTAAALKVTGGIGVGNNIMIGTVTGTPRRLDIRQLVDSYQGGIGVQDTAGVFRMNMWSDVLGGGHLSTGGPAVILDSPTNVANVYINTTAPASAAIYGTNHRILNLTSNNASSFAILDLEGNQTANTVVSQIAFSNLASPDADKRTAVISCNIDGSPNTGKLEFITNRSGVFNTRMTVVSDGDIGVGTSFPKEHFTASNRRFVTISGASVGTNANVALGLGGSFSNIGNAVGHIQYFNMAGSHPTDKRIAQISGHTDGVIDRGLINFGIGISGTMTNFMSITNIGVNIFHGTPSTSPTTGTLVVTGGLGVTGQISAGPSIVSLGDGASIHINALSSTDSVFKFWSNNVPQWTFANQVSTGNQLLIHDSDTTHGVVLAQNTTSWTAFSDKRMRHKQNARTVSGLLTKLDKFRLVEYGRDHSEIGVLAQELHSFLPQLTIHGDDDDRIIDRVTDGRVWGVKPSEAAFVALQIAKEIWEDVDRRLTHLETTH